MRFYVPVLVAVVLWGCATADPPSPISSNAQTIRSLYDAFGRGDVPAVIGTFDENLVWMAAESLPAAERNPYRGPRAVAEGIFQMIPTIWDNFQVNVERIIDGGDTVVALGRYRARHRQTGKPLDAQFVHVWDVRNGKVVRFQQYVDTAQFARVATP